jgi:hypothetical protein
LLDTPAWDRVQRRSAQRLSGTKTETGVVPGTADGVLYQDPFGERTVVVGAFGADREQLVTTARQQHRVARDVPQDLAVFSDIRKRHPLGKVGSVEPLLLFAHGWLLTYDGWKISQRRRRDPVLPIRTITVEDRRHFEPEKVNLSRGSYLRPKPPMCPIPGLKRPNLAAP